MIFRTEHCGILLALLVLVLSAGEGCTAGRFPGEAKPPKKGEGPDPGGLSAPGCVTTGCHSGMSRIKRPHSPVREKRCDACHVEIAPGHPDKPGREFGQKIAILVDLCLSCHDALAREIRSATAIHAPVVQGRCGACHDPHGTDFPMLFSKVTWRSEWEWPFGPPEIEVTKLCWQCHDRDVLTGNKPTTATRFRDGDRNLHSSHVNYPKGRRCKGCHETHAGRQPALMRESVPFGTGGWKLPVRFTPTSNGGSCVVGCHRPRDYSRGVGERRNP